MGNGEKDGSFWCGTIIGQMVASIHPILHPTHLVQDIAKAGNGTGWLDFDWKGWVRDE